VLQVGPGATWALSEPDKGEEPEDESSENRPCRKRNKMTTDTTEMLQEEGPMRAKAPEPNNIAERERLSPTTPRGKSDPARPGRARLPPPRHRFHRFRGGDRSRAKALQLYC